MGLFGRKKTTVGLDIGSGLVKVAVVDHSKSTPELVKVAITPLPDDAIVEGEVMDPHVVSEVIRNAKHAFRQTDSRPAKPQKHRYERRKVRELMKLGDWSQDAA